MSDVEDVTTPISIVEIDDDYEMDETTNEADSTQIKGEHRENTELDTIDPLDLLEDPSSPNHHQPLAEINVVNEADSNSLDMKLSHVPFEPIVTNEADRYKEGPDIDEILEIDLLDEEAEEDEESIDRNGQINESDLYDSTTPESIRENQRFFNTWLFEFVPDDPKYLRCNLCDRTFGKSHKQRHLAARSHISLWNVYKKKRLTDIKSENDNYPEDIKGFTHQNFDWPALQRVHPWIAPCPSDNTQAYCVLCETIVVEGSCQIKRDLHEQSYSHYCAAEREKRSAAMSADFNKIQTADSQGDAKAHKPDSQSDAAAKSTNGIESFQGTKRKSLPLVGSKEWFEKYFWLKETKKSPDYYLCVYCNIFVQKRNCRPLKHASTYRHRESERQALSKAAAAASNETSAKKSSDSEYPWAQDKGVEIYCTYCSMYFSKNKSNQEHAKSLRHREAVHRMETANKVSKPVEAPEPPKLNTIEVASTEPSTMQQTVSATENLNKWKNRCKDLRKLYPWLTFNRISDPGCIINCNYCKIEIKFRWSSNIAKHCRSLTHQQKTKDKKRMQRQQLLKQTSQLKSQQPDSNETVPTETPKVAEKAVEVEAKNDNPKKEDGRKLWFSIFEEYKWIAPTKKITRNSDTFPDRSKATKLSCIYCDKIFSAYCVAHINNHAKTRNHINAEKEFLNKTSNKHGVESQSASTATPNGDGKDTDQNQSEETLSRLSDAKTKNVRRESSTSLTVDSTTLPQQPSEPQQQQQQQVTSTPSSTSTPDPLDFFFDSLRTTMKALPYDLASEGKLKMMEILCNLEIRAFKRKQNPNETDVEPRSTSSASAESQRNDDVCMQKQPSNGSDNRQTSLLLQQLQAPPRLSIPESNQSFGTQQRETSFLQTIISSERTQRSEHTQEVLKTETQRQQTPEKNRYHQQQQQQQQLQKSQLQKQLTPLKPHTNTPAAIPRIGVISEARSVNNYNNVGGQSMQNTPRKNSNYSPYSSNAAQNNLSNNRDAQHDMTQPPRKIPKMNNSSTAYGQNKIQNHNHQSNKTPINQHYHQSGPLSQQMGRSPQRPNSNNNTGNVNNPNPTAPVKSVPHVQKDYEYIQVISDTGTEIITLNDLD